MDFLNQLSDNSVALLGCGGAIIVCMGVLSLSNKFSQPATKKVAEKTASPATIRMPQQDSRDRKAA